MRQVPNQKQEKPSLGSLPLEAQASTFKNSNRPIRPRSQNTTGKLEKHKLLNEAKCFLHTLWSGVRFGLFLISMKYTKRAQTVSRKPGQEDNNLPMVRIANKFLLKSGFKVGNKFYVEYGDDVVTITRLPFQFDSDDSLNNRIAVQK